MEKLKVKEDIDLSYDIEMDSDYFNEFTENISSEFEANIITYIKSNNNTPIDELLSFLNKSKELGATHVKIYASCTTDYDSPKCESLELSVFKEREETDIECKLRIDKREKENLDNLSKQRKAEYEKFLKLKEKYDNN